MASIPPSLALTHSIGFLGCVTNGLLAFSPLRAVMTASRLGNLGGLDTRPWPLFLICNMVWSGYSIVLGDVWVLLSSVPFAIIWLYFNIVAIRLLCVEDSELDRSAVRQWEGGIFQRSKYDLSSMCRDYRLECIKRNEQGIIFGVGVTLFGTFLCIQWHIPGLEFLDTYFTLDIKQKIFMVLTTVVSMITYAQPLTRLVSLVKRRDASTIFIPLVGATMLNNVVWLVYGMIKADFALLLPNAVGFVLSIIQLILRCVFNGKGAANTEEDEDEGNMRSSRCSRASVPSVTSASMFSEIDVMFDERPAQTFRRVSQLDVGMVPLDADAPTLLSSRRRLSVVEKQRTEKSMKKLPDLTKKLQEIGAYEDYLQWQAEYRTSRKDGMRKARTLK